MGYNIRPQQYCLVIINEKADKGLMHPMIVHGLKHGLFIVVHIEFLAVSNLSSVMRIVQGYNSITGTYVTLRYIPIGI